MPYKTIQQNFANGELNPKMQGRADVDMYYKSAQKMRDVVTTPYGGFVRRPGSRMISGLAETYGESDGKNIRLIPFVFNNEQSYLLAISEGKVEIFYKDVLIKTLSNSNFTNDNVMHIKYAQTADSCILVHKDFPPLRLLRETNSVSPTLREVQISDGWLSSTSGRGRLSTNFRLDVSSSQPLEFVMRVKWPNSLRNGTVYFYLSNSFYFGIQDHSSQSMAGMKIYCDSSGATIQSGAFWTYVDRLTEDTYCTVKLTRDTEGNYTFSYSTDDGETYATVGTFTNSKGEKYQFELMQQYDE